MIQYRYFLISLVPDPLRNEQINVGIIGLTKDRYECRALKDLQRVRILNPNYDTTANPMDSIIALLAGIPSDQHESYLKHFHGDFVRVSPTAEGRAESYDRFVAAIDEIYDRLVKPIAPVAAEAKGKVTQLKTAVKRALSSRGLLGQRIEEKKVVTDYAISLSENLVADFAYRNGNLNIIETIDFQVRAERLKSDKFKEAALLSIKILEAKEQDKQAKGRLIYIPPAKDPDRILAHTHMLNKYYDSTYNFQDVNDRGRFYADIEHDLIGSLSL